MSAHGVVTYGRNSTSGIVSVTVKSDVVRMYDGDGHLFEFSPDCKNGIRIEIRGSVQKVIVLNSAIVYGNINKAFVGNSCNVDGFIKDYKCPRDTVTYDTNIYVCHGVEYLKRINSYNPETYKSPRVIKINGVPEVSVNAQNTRCEVVCFCDVDTIKVSNCLMVRGTVNFCQSGNMLRMTANNGKAKSTKEILKEREMMQRQADDMLSSLFGGMDSERSSRREAESAYNMLRGVVGNKGFFS